MIKGAQFGTIVRYVGVPCFEKQVGGGVVFPRCDNGSCFARPPYVVLLTEAVMSDVRIVNTLRLCRHHAEQITDRRIE